MTELSANGHQSRHGRSSRNSPRRNQYATHPPTPLLTTKKLTPFFKLRYNGLLLSDIFKPNGEAALHALEQAEMIAIVSVNGRPHSIRPGKPVYTSAFKLLTEDRVLKARLDLSTLGELTKGENASIDKVEAELSLLGKLPEQGVATRERARWLMGKLKGSQEKVEGYERESGELKKVLLGQF